MITTIIIIAFIIVLFTLQNKFMKPVRKVLNLYNGKELQQALKDATADKKYLQKEASDWIGGRPDDRG